MRRALPALAATIGLLAPALHGQQPAPRPSLWGFAAVTTYSAADCAELCGNTGIVVAGAWQPSRILLTARTGLAQDDEGSWAPRDIGVLVGYGTRPGGVIHAHAAVGLGYGEVPPAARSGLGVPFEAQVAWRPLTWLGLALHGWGNSLGPLGGVGAGIQLGRLR